MPKNRYQLLRISLILTAAVMTKYSGLYLIVFAFIYLLRRDGFKPACMAVLLPLTAFAGWCLRNLALTGSLMGTRAAARFPAGESIGGMLVTLAQFGGVICGLVCLEILFSRLLSGTRRSSS